VPCALGAAAPSQGEEEQQSGGDLDAELLPLGKKLGEIVSEIIQCEVVYNSWTLMHRYFRCRDILKDKLDINNRDYAAFLMIWLRYSFIRQLTWQKRYNTKPKELQHSQLCLTEEICAKYLWSLQTYGMSSHTLLNTADLLRQTLGLVGKGSGSGQRVRDEILHIMHRHKISERAGHFYEQWH